MPASLHALSTVSPAILAFLASATCIYVILLAVATLVATLHPDKERRADARRVLSVLLSIIPTRRRR